MAATLRRRDVADDIRALVRSRLDLEQEARREARATGRPRRYTVSEVTGAVTAYVEGATLVEAGGLVGAHHTTVARWLKRLGVPVRPVKQALEEKRRRFMDDVRKAVELAEREG